MGNIILYKVIVIMVIVWWGWRGVQIVCGFYLLITLIQFLLRY